MDDVQQNRLNRGDKVLAFLKAKASQLTATPDLNGTLQTLLTNGIKKTRDDDAMATQDNTGYGDDKDDEHDNLVSSCVHVADGLVSYGDDHDDFVIMQLYDFPISVVDKFRDGRLLEYSKSVAKKAADAAIAAEMALKHNVSGDDITELNEHITAFEAANPLPLQMKAESAAWGKQVDRDLKAIDDILEKIRRKMRTYRKTNIFLYETFVGTDTIDDYGHGGGTNSASGIVGIGETKQALAITYNAATQVTLGSTGSATLSYRIYDNGTPAGTAVSVAPNTSVITTYGAMASSGNALYVINNDSNPGNYTVAEG